MNYYGHHINDYRSATAHLSWDEDAAYRRLLDIYYATEKPLPADIGQVCRLARATKPAQRAAVDTVLGEFFTLEDDGWHNKRCDEEILLATERARRSRENGTRGGRPPKPDRNPAETQQVAAPETQQVPTRGRPIPHSPLPSISDADASENARGAARLLLSDFEVWWHGYPHKVGKAAGLKAYRTARKAVDAETLLAGVRRYAAAKAADCPWCNPATWLNQQRWLDQPAKANGTASNGSSPPDPDANLRAQAKAIAAGIFSPNATPSGIRTMLERGWITAEQAQRQGYTA